MERRRGRRVQHRAQKAEKVWRCAAYEGAPSHLYARFEAESNSGKKLKKATTYVTFVELGALEGGDGSGESGTGESGTSSETGGSEDNGGGSEQSGDSRFKVEITAKGAEGVQPLLANPKKEKLLSLQFSLSMSSSGPDWSSMPQGIEAIVEQSGKGFVAAGGFYSVAKLRPFVSATTPD